MAVKHLLTYFLFLPFLKYVKSHSIFINFTDTEKGDYNMRSHLEKDNVKMFCDKRDLICKSNDSLVCTMKRVNNTDVFKNFTNACYLFLSNMCDYPGEEFHILSSGSCEDYSTLRRHEEYIVETTKVSINNNNDTENETNSNDTVTITEYPALRNSETTGQTSEPIVVYESYDQHPCPHSCPKIYEPVCINVNRGFGPYFKMYTFVNHCFSDYYYCKKPEEFKPPPEEDQDEPLVRSSPLAWSFCGASRYLQFARFAEVTSSMNHYGWLAGKYGYAHILEPHERIPGFG